AARSGVRNVRHIEAVTSDGRGPGAFRRARSFFQEKNAMDEDDRDFPPSAWEARIEAAYRRMKQGLRPDPWLPRVTNLTGLRRQVRRARAGAIEPGNPQISTRAWAETLEQGIVLSQLEMREERRQAEEEAEREAEQQRKVLEYNRCWMEVYRALK